MGKDAGQGQHDSSGAHASGASTGGDSGKNCLFCGHFNRAVSRYCVKCGAQLEAAEAGGAPGMHEAPGAYEVPGAREAPDTGKAYSAAGIHAPGGTTGGIAAQAPPSPSTQFVPETQGGIPWGAFKTDALVREPAPAAVLPSRFREVSVVNGRAFLAGACVVMLAGAVVLASTWLAWTSGLPGSLTGWDWFDMGRMAAVDGDFTTPFLVSLEGYVVFTGLCSLLFGGLLLIAGAAMLIFRGRIMAWAAVSLSGIMLAMALVGMISVLLRQGAGIGVGLALLLAFSAAGATASIIALRSTRWAEARGAAYAKVGWA